MNYITKLFLLFVAAIKGRIMMPVRAGCNIAAHMVKYALVKFKLLTYIHWHIECFRPDGTLKWIADYTNLVVNVGLDDILDKYWKGSTYTAAHYVGLTNGTPSFAAGDTMASHAGWTENSNYDEATRETLTLGAVSGQSVDNSASKAVFTIDTDTQTLGGAFLTTDNTKGGSSGTLVGGAAFSGGDKSADDNDVINVTVTITQSAS
ncbi:MAG: hypothetical protein KAR44_15135 [Candidatus Aegiribacteria sp.]|nr:hypothetical protein [Candidatus Aegiribacteria sp.]MCK5609847.1 hypothetical protein [Candidatus Pacearchaeota archaeon]